MAIKIINLTPGEELTTIKYMSHSPCKDKSGKGMAELAIEELATSQHHPAGLVGREELAGHFVGGAFDGAIINCHLVENIHMILTARSELDPESCPYLWLWDGSHLLERVLKKTMQVMSAVACVIIILDRHLAVYIPCQFLFDVLIFRFLLSERENGTATSKK